MTPNPTVRALVSGAIDYAGLFPPAGLRMAEAVANFARYRTGPHAWMLGSFVVPAVRLEELAAAYAARRATEADPWPLSVIARGADTAALVAFHTRYGGRLAIRMIEAPPTPIDDLASLEPLAALWAVYVEVDATVNPRAAIEALKRRGLRAKVRTGGVKAELFPTADQVARFVESCRALGVPFKATAGLHHLWRAEYPLTYDPASARATMFGFANVLLGASAALAGADATEVAGVLAGRDGDGFELADEGCVLPSGRAVSAALVASARDSLINSFGSCSFEEPVAELTARGLL